jgi:hypothetical protein
MGYVEAPQSITILYSHDLHGDFNLCSKTGPTFTYTGHRNVQASVSRLNYYGTAYIFTYYSWYLNQTHIVKINGDKLNLDTCYSICIFRAAAYVLNMTLPGQWAVVLAVVTLTTTGAESDVHNPHQ